MATRAVVCALLFKPSIVAIVCSIVVWELCAPRRVSVWIKSNGSQELVMHIVHVVRQFHPAIGGLETCVQELAAEQITNGHRVSVITLDRIFGAKNEQSLPKFESLASRIQIIRIPFIGSQRYPIAWRVLKYLRDVDVVHVHGIDFFFDFLAWTRIIHRKKLIVSTHGGFFHTAFAKSLKRIYFAIVTKASAKAYSAVVAVSSADQQQFDRIRPGGVVCVENGINLRKFANCAAQAPQKAIVSHGRFSDNKRIDCLVTFFAALHRRDPSWRLYLAGRRWNVDVNEIQALARASGVSGAVKVVESPDDEMLREIMGRCSVFATASEYEGFGIAAVEAMAGGLFPVLSDIPPFRHLFNQTGVGMIADFRDIEGSVERFLAKWREIENAPDVFRARATRAAAVYDWGRVADKYQEVYNTALGRSKRWILNVPIQVESFTSAVEHLDERFDANTPTTVAFANAHTLNTASSDPAFQTVLQHAMVFNDGIGVDIASRLQYGVPFPENLNGTDFMPAYLGTTRHRFRIFLLGSRPGIADKAANWVRTHFPQHAVVGVHHGYIGPEDNARIVDFIRKASADVVLVAMGDPKQEFWLADNLAATGCRLGFGVGALLDFVAGEVPRASQTIRRAHLEWAYRLAIEPRRLWRRYVVGCSAFLGRIAVQWWSGVRVPNSVSMF